MAGYIGIDYGMGTSNRDPETGIRFGVISQGSIMQAWADSSEPYYGDAHCPTCGDEAVEYDAEKHDDYEHDGGSADYVCEACKYIFDSSEAFPDEALGYSVNDGEYVMEDCLDSDVMILKSPYYTFAQFCSPCVPGAGNLDNAMEDGVKTYCLGHDWFEEGIAPYPVYRVSDNSKMRANSDGTTTPSRPSRPLPK